jgi:hypothetical protein
MADVGHVLDRRRLVSGGEQPGRRVVRLDRERFALVDPQDRRKRCVETVD